MDMQGRAIDTGRDANFKHKKWSIEYDKKVIHGLKSRAKKVHLKAQKPAIAGHTDWPLKMSGAQKMDDDHAALGRLPSIDWGLRNTSLLSSWLYILSSGTWNSFWKNKCDLSTVFI